MVRVLGERCLGFGASCSGNGNAMEPNVPSGAI